jgi:hypothetical protein
VTIPEAKNKQADRPETEKDRVVSVVNVSNQKVKVIQNELYGIFLLTVARTTSDVVAVLHGGVVLVVVAA